MRLYEVLDDREWHNEEEVIREVGKVIPPGQAIRRNELRRANQRGKKEERQRPLSEERRITAGRRDFVRDALTASAKYHEVKVVDGQRWVRATGIPPRVARDRARARAHFHLDPELLADEIAQGADADALLSELDRQQLKKVALELARRERRRFLQR
jgi:hypothetical protein